MPDAGLAREVARPRLWSREAMAYACVCAFIFIYYWALLSDGKFLAVEPVHYGLTFNSMLDYMAHGRFDVDPSIIGHEGFTRDGRVYAYFGPVPALLRLPLLLWPRYDDVDFTTLSCAIAATLAAMAKLAAVLRARGIMGDVPYARYVTLLAVAIVIFGGAQVQFLRPSLFQEPLYWASAEAAGLVLLAFTWCVDPLSRRRWHLVAMTILAGLCLLTRVSTAIGLFLACGAIMLTQLIDGWRTKSIAAAIRRTVIPSLILLAFVVVCFYINHKRWDAPLTFQDYKYYNSMTPNDPTFAVIAKYGYFNLNRLWFGLSYYFVPIWTIIGSDGHFLFRAAQDRLLYTVEYPPATFLASDLFLCFLTCLGCGWLWRDRFTRTDRLTACMVAVGLAAPGFLMLIAIAMIYRYRLEFYPFFEFLGLFGLFALQRGLASRPRPLNGLCAGMVAVSIVFSHLFLVSYKTAPWGDSAEIEKMGWAAAYRHYFDQTYPQVETLLDH